MARRPHTIRTALQLGTAALALLATPAFAQDGNAPAADPAANDVDIVVTARRREETLLSVPIAITAFSGAKLESQGAIDITDVGNVTPNVTLEVSRGTNSTLSAFIRGVGQQDPVAGFEAGVGLYIDDVYLNRPQAAVLDIYDVERIEVLRGPQGTLYGRNTIGGAIKYVTRRIGDDPELNVRATYGSYNQADGVISASTPIGSSGFAIGGAVARLTRDGFGKNLTTGQENYNKDIWAARGTLQFEPSSDAYFRLSGDYTHDTSNTRGGHRLIPTLPAAGAIQPILNDVFDSRGSLIAPKQDVESYGGSFFAELKPSDWLTIRSITGYRKDNSATPIDFDATALVDVDVPAFYNNHQFSQEAQALIATGGLNALLGIYYLDAGARTVFDVRLPAALTALTAGDVNTNTTAIFGDATYDFSPQFSVSVGGRYTWDMRDSVVQRNVYIGSSPFFGGTTAPLVRQTDFQGKASFKQFTPRASVSFKPTPDHNIYASWSKGFKGGGFDPRGVGSAAPDFNGNGIVGNADYADVYRFLSFKPEKVTSYEVGYKASLLDRRVTLALAGFHAKYTDIQIPGSVGAVVGGIPTFIGITTNAAKANFNGFEAEGNLVVAQDFLGAGDRLNFSGTLGYLDTKFKRYIDSRGVDVSDRRKIQNTPKWTFSETISYTVPVGDGSIDASGTMSYRSASQQFEIRTPLLDQGAFGLFDANLVWNIDKTFSVGVHGKNLGDKKYIVSGYNFLGQNPDTGVFLRGPTGNYVSTLGNTGTLTAYYGNPRQVFVTASAKF